MFVKAFMLILLLKPVHYLSCKFVLLNFMVVLGFRHYIVMVTNFKIGYYYTEKG